MPACATASVARRCPGNRRMTSGSQPSMERLADERQRHIGRTGQDLDGAAAAFEVCVTGDLYTRKAAPRLWICLQVTVVVDDDDPARNQPRVDALQAREDGLAEVTVKVCETDLI